MVPAFEENLWIIAMHVPGTVERWSARCLNLDVVSTSATLEGALRAASRAIEYCLMDGAPSARRRAAGDEWALLERLVRDGAFGEPPPDADVLVASQVQVMGGACSVNVFRRVERVRRLPLVWLARDALPGRSSSGRRLWPWSPNRLAAERRAWRRQTRRQRRCGSMCPEWATAKGMDVSKAPEIIITTQDFERLQRLVASSDSLAAERLDAELARARLVAQTEIPADVVTMNSDVVYEDADSGQLRTVRLVYPKDAQATRGWVSVLAPVGSALLGLRRGQEIDWPTPRGSRRLRVVAVPYQPESAGDYSL